MERRDIIVVGASAGGVTALRGFVQNLPKDFKGSVFIVLHIPPYTESKLPTILSKAGPLEAVHPQDEEEIVPGKIYVATNDYHLLIARDKVMVKRGPKENRFRPSIDALFRSAAYTYRSRVVGIIFSGILNDGVSGLWTIKQHGGLAIVQNPDDAEHPQLPQNVLEYVEPDYVKPASEIGSLISQLVREKAPEQKQRPEKELKQLEAEVLIAMKGNAFEMGIMNLGEFTPFTCPECHGALVKLVEGDIIRFRCHTGHAYTASSLLAEVSELVESDLWRSVRTLEEMTMLLSNIGEQFEKKNNPEAASLFHAKAEESAKRARNIHDAVFLQNKYSEDLRLNHS
jgi:two-component system chemotaxis response regulator CheB